MVVGAKKAADRNAPADAGFSMRSPTTTLTMSTLRSNVLLASCLVVTFAFAQSEQITAPTTQLQFAEMEHDFGRILQGSENAYVFKFKNTGTVPLIISDAVGSCGCTVPSFPNDAIMPDGEGEIRVVYKPGQQQGEQHKTVTITANTQPKETMLQIKADVLVDPNYIAEPVEVAPIPEPWEPPVSETITPQGPVTTIGFDEMEHDFGDVPQGSENPYVFKFKNTGDQPLLIMDAKGSCGCTVPFYDRAPIPPGGESEIHVVYKPGKQQGRQSKTVTITANTEPRQTVFNIRANVFVVDSITAPSFIALEEEHREDRKAVEAVSPGCFVIFPNPTSHELRLDLKEHIGRSADVRIHDETGRDMLRTRIASINSETSRLDVASFPPGIYIVTIQVEGEQPMSQCFVVDR
jgi:Protein of unknown function (DUF1573)/Secretion system C-terminal sorting domain